MANKKPRKKAPPKKRVRSYSEEELEYWLEIKRENSKPRKKAPAKKAPTKKASTKKAPTKKPQTKKAPVSQHREVLSDRARRLTSPKGKKFKDITIPIHYQNGKANMTRAYVDWEAVIAALRLNPRVYATNTLLYYEHGDTIQAYPLSEARIAPKRAELEENFEKIKDQYLVEKIEDLKLLSLVVHVIFKSAYVRRK